MVRKEGVRNGKFGTMRAEFFMDYDTAKDRFLNYLLVAKDMSSHTLRNYRIDLELFKKYIESVKDKCIFDQVDRRMVRGFLAHLRLQHKSSKTIVRRLSSLRSFFLWSYTNKYIVSNPCEDIETPKVEKRVPNFLSYKQVKLLMELPKIDSYLGLRDRVILELFYSSGLRLSELVGLNKNDFDRVSKTLKIRGKGKKERIVPMTYCLCEWLKKYLECPKRTEKSKEHFPEMDKEAIFLNKHGKRISARSVDRTFAKYLLLSGIVGRVTPHTIRHTIATHWLEKGMDLKMIKSLLGHKSLQSTTIYTHVSSRLKRKVYEEAHPRAKKHKRS